MSLSLGKLWRSSKPAKDPEGRMTLYEHLAELRSRLMKACLAIFVASGVAWYFYDWIFNRIQQPLLTAIASLDNHLDIKINWSEVSAGLMMQVTVSLVGGLVISSPIWLYQIWAFIVPGLHANEKKWTLAFLGTAAPLFVTGVLVGYFVMPKGLSVLFSFTPPGPISANYLDASYYLGFILRMLLIFGVAFEIPIFVVLLNLVGVLSARRLAKWRAGIVFGIFVFAAVATPSVDPISMLMLAIPMSLLFIGAEIVARIIERARRRRLSEEDPDLVVTGEYDDD